MEDLMDNLDQTKWAQIDASQKKDFTEFQVMRQHKKIDATTFKYLIQTDPDEEPKGVFIYFTVKDKDPLKNIGTAELLINGDQIVGIDLDGDCYQMK